MALLQSDRDYIADLQRKYNEANSERNRMLSEVEKLRVSLERANAELDGEWIVLLGNDRIYFHCRCAQ